MSGQWHGWIVPASIWLGGAGVIWLEVLWFRRLRRRRSVRIYFTKYMEAGNRRLTIYPLKLTGAQQEELAIIEKRLLELADSAEEDMTIRLKEDGQAK